MHTKTKIVGLTGTHGSGKGEIVLYLRSKGYQHISARELLLLEIEKRHLPRSRDSMNLVANDLRTKFGPEHVAFSLYVAAHHSGGRSVIESIYTEAEIGKIRDAAFAYQERFVLIAVDADPKLRFECIQARQSETDKVSFQEFMKMQELEMSSDDSHKHNLALCRRMSDMQITNDGSKEELRRTLDKRFGDLCLI